MYTGIIEEVGEIVAIDDSQEFRTLRVRANGVLDGLSPGDSIAVNGVCLTVRKHENSAFTADLSRETLDRTSLKELGAGALVNLERPMRADGRFGGHIVQGHVDGVGKIRSLPAAATAGTCRSSFLRRPGAILSRRVPSPWMESA